MKNKLMIVIMAMVVVTSVTSNATAGVSDLPGKVVAIWSKGAEQFVRSAGVDGGILRADRKSYEANDEGRFLCFAEEGGTIAIMDVMLERYLTHTGGKLISAVSGAAATRRFTLVDQGNNYYAIKANNGKYVRVNGTGELVVDADVVTDDAVFAIVPIRTGPNVVMRAYNGDDPYDQLPSIPNAAAQFCLNPEDFPVNKVNIGMLQMAPILYSDQQFIDMRKVWNTDKYETEFILPYHSQKSMTSQVDALIGRIKQLEGVGYTFDYVILYHEILAGLPAGPWSDPRVSSQEEIDLVRSRIIYAFFAGEVNYPYYKIFCMPYQFTEGSVMYIPGWDPIDVGCDAACLEFIKNNFDGMFLEVNGHDYVIDNGAPDAAAAAVWCRDNGLEFGITSGAGGKDTNYKTMYQDIFAEMDSAGFDKSWDKMHYILHHVYQPYEDRLPEWVENTTTENSKWLIENVMPHETPSISSIDTDGDSFSDLEEALAGSFPLDADSIPIYGLLFDDFSTYTNGSINGQSGSPVGFSGTWTANGSVTVGSGVLSQGANLLRSYRSLSSPITSGKIYLRANMALSNADYTVNFSAIELDQTGGSGLLAIRLTGNSYGLSVSVYDQESSTGTSSGIIASNDGGEHEWLIELNLDTLAGKAWIDVDTAAFDPSTGGAGFTAPTGFEFNNINVSTFGASSSVVIDDIRIGDSWSDIGVAIQICPDLDGFIPVNLLDFAVLSSNWQLTGPSVSGDFNTDGTIDIYDLKILVSHWLNDCSQ